MAADDEQLQIRARRLDYALRKLSQLTCGGSCSLTVHHPECALGIVLDEVGRLHAQVGRLVAQLESRLAQEVVAEASAQLVASVAKPRFKHDCAACTWLEHCCGYDLYWCTQPALGDGRWPTLVARYGDDGPDYTTWNVAMQGEPVNEPFISGARTARERGLLR